MNVNGYTMLAAHIGGSVMIGCGSNWMVGIGVFMVSAVLMIVLKGTIESAFDETRS